MDVKAADADSVFDEQRSAPVDLNKLIVPTKPAQTQQRYKQASSTRICINGYQLDMSNAIEIVYKFELKISALKEDGKEKELHRGPKNDVAMILRHRVLWSIFNLMLKKNEHVFGNDNKKFFYDCGINFYSIEKLFDRSEGDREFVLKVEDLSSTSRDFMGRKVVSVIARLLPCEEVSLRDTAAVAELLKDRERSLQQFLEIATTQMLYHDQNHMVFGNKAYDRPGQRDVVLSGGKVLVSGMMKNVRLIGNSWDSSMPLVQIDAKKAAFFKEQSLVDLVGILCNRANPKQLLEDQRLRVKVAKQLKDLVVRTNHLQTQRVFSIFGVSSEPADKLKISIDGKEMTVADYVVSKYQRRLKLPYLPCIIERRIVAKTGGVGNNFHPMEFLEVIRGQRVDIKKQTPELVDELINNCRLLPSALKSENERQRCRASIDSENPYLRRLGIKVVSSPMGTHASVHFPPAILYRNGKVEPNANGEIDWRLSVPRGMQNRQFFIPATPPRRWVVFLFQNAVDKQTADAFILALVRRARDHGLNLPNPSRSESYDTCEYAFLHDKLQFMRRNGVEYVLFITREKRDPVHDSMKLAEVHHSIVTQHVHSKTVLKAISNRGAEMTLDNILMKTNLKLGGLTHSLASSASFLSKNRLNANIMEREWLRSTRMFVGLDMSHAGPQSLYERQAKIPPSDPTVVGMSFSCGEALMMRGEYWMQTSRLHTIQFLKEHMEKALKMFKDESKGKHLPEHVLIFRGGASEGEYAKIMTEEVDQIREAFVAAAEGRQERVRLSLLVIQANSNYRMYPEMNQQGSAAQQNVAPGTIVDSDVVHPTQTEFIMVAHKSIMGTARPIRCTLLVDDEPRMSLDELEGVTNALCYAHGIVTSPISTPAFLYSAADLAKRGRNNWRTANYGEDSMSTVSSEEGGRFRNDGSESFFPDISTELAPKLKHKFWA